jgi:murein L,D-transpeptidase YcbB/YkuD
MARFVLSDLPDWQDERMQQVIQSGKTRDVLLKQPFPVILLYQTAWLKTDDSLVFAYDIYGEDIKLYDALVKAGKTPRIGN